MVETGQIQTVKSEEPKQSLNGIGNDAENALGNENRNIAEVVMGL